MKPLKDTIGARFGAMLGSCAFITVVAFALRFAILSYGWVHERTPIKSFLPFGWELGQVASSIAAGRGFSSPLQLVRTGATAWFTPIYPYFVAGIFKVWGIFSPASRLLIETSNCTFAALTVIPIYAIAQRTFGKRVAVAAAWVWTFLPSSVFFPVTWVWDTTLAALLLALLFWATLAIRETKSTAAWAGYGALWGIGVLTNPALFSVCPFLAGWATAQAAGKRFPTVRTSAAAALVFCIALVPWTVRNYLVLGKAIVFRSNFGLELWLGNNPGVPDTWAPWMHPNDDPKEAEKYKRMGEVAYMQEKEREALAFMRSHPSDTLGLILHRFADTWLASADFRADGVSLSWYFVSGFVLNALLSGFALFGTLFAHRARLAEAVPFAMVLLVFPLIFYLTHSSLRYRFPMDPILVVLAAYGVAHTLGVCAERFTRQRAPAAAAPEAMSR